jgi:hypothetical protein
MTENELLELFDTISEEANRTKYAAPLLNNLRNNFWREYDNACMQDKKMSAELIWKGVCSRWIFYQRVYHNDVKLAWLLTPPTSYHMQSEECLTLGMKHLRDYMSGYDFQTIPVTVKDKVDHQRAIAMILQIVKFLDSRVHGAPVTRNQNYNVVEMRNRPAALPSEVDIDAEIAVLDAEIARPKNALPPARVKKEKKETESD